MNEVSVAAPRSLTDQQKRFVEELVTTACTGTEAAERAGFAMPSREQWRLMQKPHVMAAIRKERERLISGTLCNIAVKTLTEIMVDAALPASARVAACRVSLDMGGHLGKGGQADDRDVPLHEMTDAQLHEFLERAQAEVDAGGDRPLIEIIA